MPDNIPDFDRSKSLQALDGADWGEPTFHSHVVTESHRLHRTPLRDFNVADLSLMIGQQIGLQYLLPIALERLSADPLAEGDYYPGDLLASVLRADSRFLVASPALRSEVARIAELAFSLLPTLDQLDRETTRDALTDARDIFQKAEYFAQHGRA